MRCENFRGQDQGKQSRTPNEGKKKVKLSGKGRLLQIDFHSIFADQLIKVYGETPDVELITLSKIDDLIEQALKNIYSGESLYFDENLWKITTNELNKAVDDIYNESPEGGGGKFFKNKLKFQNSIFSAFKSANQARTLAHLKEAVKSESFQEYKKRALKITQDYNINWLKTEYKTAKGRIRLAKNYQDALKDADLYPNAEYMPSRAVHPRDGHKPYYGVILPLDHPWYDTHMPPSVWGCECWWRSTAEKPTAPPSSDLSTVSPGLDINPGKTGQIFSNNHKYFKELENAAPTILKENVAAMNKQSVDNFTEFWAHVASNGCAYSFERLGYERATNVKIGRIFAALGNDVQLFGYNKIDSKINGVWNEFKALKSLSFNSFDKNIQKANNQLKKHKLTGDLTLSCGLPEKDMILKAFKSRFSRPGFENHLERIHFIIDDNYKGYSTIEEVLKGKLPF